MQADAFVVQPMMWGLVPPWHRGLVASSHRLTTNNARLEGLAESKLYKPVVENGQRCVIVSDGFYEWKKSEKNSGQKQPYIVFASQEQAEQNRIELFAQLQLDLCWSTAEEKWIGPRPLFMAGLYSVWYADDDRQDKKRPCYSYTVITRYV